MVIIRSGSLQQVRDGADRSAHATLTATAILLPFILRSKLAFPPLPNSRLRVRKSQHRQQYQHTISHVNSAWNNARYGPGGRIKKEVTENESQHAVGEQAQPSLHARWEAEFFDFLVHLDPTDGSLSNGPREGRDCDNWSKPGGNYSSVRPDCRITPPFGVDLGFTGIHGREKMW